VRLAGAGALASIGTVGDSYDNALAESIIGLYKTECVRLDGPFKTVDELELATLSWVHWSPPAAALRPRPHPPDRDEQAYYRHNDHRQQSLPGEQTVH
jgi:putative transposase